jgi:hypothetical protein
VRVRHLPDEPRLPDTRFADEGDHLASPRGGPPEGLSKLLEVSLPSDEACEAARGGGVQPGPERSSRGHLVHLDGCLQPLHRHGAERLDRDVALGEAEGVDGQADRPRRRELLHAGGQVRRLAHGRVIHP